MALQFSYVDKFGNTNATAYARILSVRTSAEIGADIEVAIYINAASRSKAAPEDEKQPVIKYMESVTGSDEATYFADSVLSANTVSPFKKAYTYLKTLRRNTPGDVMDFTSATDI